MHKHPAVPRGLLCLVVLLLTVCLSVTCHLTVGSTNATQNITKVATIGLGFPASDSRYPVSYGFGGMYYSVQKHQTLVATNLSSEQVAFHLDLPAGNGAWKQAIGATRSGYLAISLPEQALIFDPRGNFVSSFSTGQSKFFTGGFGRLGADSLVFVSFAASTNGALISMNLKTGQQRVLQEGPFFRGGFPSEEDQKSKNTTTVVLLASGKIYEYNYKTNVTNWVIKPVYGRSFKGQDATHIFATNSTSRGEYLMVYNKATLEKEAQVGPYAYPANGALEIGLDHRVPPVVHGGLIYIVSQHSDDAKGAHHRRLDIANISTGAVVEQRHLPANPLVLTGTHLVSWGVEDFSVVSYPGGRTTLNITTKVSGNFSTPSLITALPGTDLVVGTFSNTMQVRDLKTGALVYQQPLTTGDGHALPPYVLAEQRLLVVTSGDKADVFQF